MWAVVITNKRPREFRPDPSTVRLGTPLAVREPGSDLVCVTALERAIYSWPVDGLTDAGLVGFVFAV